MEDWDCVAPTEVASGAAAAAQTRSALGLDARGGAAAAPLSFLGSLTGAVTAGVGKTARTVSKVMGTYLKLIVSCSGVVFLDGFEIV